ncbi:MAG: zinc ribbon domain-containing protein [candidate division Zixibacteria bacterium]|nr:zinc ribbon domain-containing protein [candidate division Zixibacteria bacterium]
MPTYEYLCDDCHYEFEEFQSITEDPITSCPQCKGHVHRLISGGAGLLFKGSGFYETDYRSSAYREAARKDKTTGGTTDSSSGSTTAKADKTAKGSKSNEAA